MNFDTPLSVTPTEDCPDGPDAGAPQRRRGWSRGQTIAAFGVAAVIAAFGGAAIYAATGGSSSAMGPGVHRLRHCPANSSWQVKTAGT
jgi:hypothetical protein